VRNGLRVDLTYQAALRRRLQAEVEHKAAEVNALLVRNASLAKALEGANGLYETEKNGKFCRTEKGALRRSKLRLQRILLGVLDEIEQSSRQRPQIRNTEKGNGITTAAEVWSEWRGHHRFLDLWLELESIVKLIQFTAEARPVVHPRYVVIHRTGRTSCYRPNLQNVPRTRGVREMYVPRPGHVLMAVDYSQIELRAIAHICYAAYGFSNLRDVFAEGVDPHANTAASITGVTLAALAERQDFKVLRQNAKAINFGVPGGMGPASLAAYAKTNYGVDLTVELAAHWRDKLVRQVYPELSRYLQSNDMASLARNLGADEESLWTSFQFVGGDGRVVRDGRVVGWLRRVIRGCTSSRDGAPYDREHLARVWSKLRSLCRNVDMLPLLDGLGSELTGAKLFATPAATLTGRVRNGCSFTQAKNTPFQGLAADGAKLALFELVRRGWRVVGFIHDEVLVEVPEGCDYDEKAGELVDVLVTSMRRVCPNVNVECGDPVVMTRWSKDAEPVRDELQRLRPWSPEPESSSPLAADTVAGGMRECLEPTVI
jgi:hypothetical protein